MNTIVIHGRLGADAEPRTTQSGTSLLSFRVGSDVHVKGEKQTNWFGCTLWGKRAEGRLGEYLLKGTQVVVSGVLSTREYNDKTYLEVNVSELALCGGGERKQQAEDDDFEPPFS